MNSSPIDDMWYLEDVEEESSLLMVLTDEHADVLL